MIIKNLIAIISLSLLCTIVHAWPTKNITLIVPYPPGGPADVIARAAGPDLESILKTNVVVLNIVGGSNLVAIRQVLSRENDDHTFIFSTDEFINGPILQNTKTYDEFVMTNLVGTVPYVLFSNTNTTLKIFKSSVKYQENINIGVGLVSGGPNFLIDALRKTSKLNISTIPYKGASPLLVDVLGGHVTYGAVVPFAISDLVSANKITPILVSSKSRSAAYPNTPTAHELGFKNTNIITWYAAFSRKDTSDEAKTKFSDAMHLIIANNIKFNTFKTNGMDLQNLTGPSVNKFYDNEVSKYTQYKK